MGTRNSNGGFENDDGTLRPRPYLSAVTKMSRPNFFMRHPYVSISAGLVAAGLVAAGLYLSPLRINIDITYNQSQSESNEASRIELSESMIEEPISDIELIAGFFDEENSLSEYTEDQQAIFGRCGITNEESYIQYAEGELNPKVSPSE